MGDGASNDGSLQSTKADVVGRKAQIAIVES